MLIVVLGLAQLPLLVSREPTPASPMMQSFEAACPGTRLRISGHGLARPGHRRVRLEINGQLAQGPLAEQMTRDLSNMRAVYRLVGLCDPAGHSLQLQIWAGEGNGDGTVRYSMASAGLHAGRLLAYGGLQPIDAEAFWFR